MFNLLIDQLKALTVVKALLLCFLLIIVAIPIIIVLMLSYITFHLENFVYWIQPSIIRFGIKLGFHKR